MDSLREQWLILVSTPIYLVLIVGEIILSQWGHRQWYNKKDSLTNFWLMCCNGALDLGFRVVSLAVLDFFYQRAIGTVSPIWLYWVLLVLAEDFMYYWLHRFDHNIRLFWAVHVTHHSSEKMNFTVGFRSSVFQPLYRFVYFIPLAFLGFAPIDIAFVYAATQIWGIFVHTESIGKLGWLEWVMVTPSHHRVHHGSNPKYLDKNMGMFLIVWDRLFGTFQQELPAQEYQPIRYGLTQNLGTHRLPKVIFHEWQSMRQDLKRPGLSWKQKWQYIFGLPGWSHDGSRKTSAEMRAVEAEGH